MEIKTTKVFDRLALNHKKRFKILQGGTASSKTMSILQYLIILAKRSTQNKRVTIVSETMPHLRDGALEDFFVILGDSYSPKFHNKTHNTYNVGKWQFSFRGADDPKKLRGPRRDILYINECNRVNFESFSQLEMRTAEWVFLDYNPSSEFWVHTELLPSLKDEEYFFDISTFKDNQYLPPNVINSIERRKYNPDGTISEHYKVYGLGQIGSLDGTVFSNWEQIDEFPDMPSNLGLDFGFSVDPAGLVRVAVKNNTVYVDELMYKLEMTNQDLAEEFKSMGIERGEIIYADCQEPKSIKELRNTGLTVLPSIKGKDSIAVGIDWLLSRNIKVTKRSLNLIKELRNYTRLKDRDGEYIKNKFIDDYNHLIDGIRYACTPHVNKMKVRFKKVVF